MHRIGPRVLRIRAHNWTQNVTTMYCNYPTCRVGRTLQSFRTNCDLRRDHCTCRQVSLCLVSVIGDATARQVERGEAS